MLKLRINTDKRARLYRSRWGTATVILFLACICVFMILPIFYSILQSLKPLDELFAYPPRFFVRNPTLNNFKQVFQLADNLWVPFNRYLFNSIFISVVGTSVYIVIASMAAYPLAKAKFPGSVVLSTVVVWTMLFRTEVTAVPQYIVISGLGLINTYASIILPAMAGTMGIFLMKQFMIAAIPDEILEASRIDGTSEYTILWKIVFPCVKPGWLTLIIFTFQALWNSTGGQYIYSENLKMLPSVLGNIAAGGIARAGAGSAVAVLLMIPPIVIFILSQSSVIETMSHSGLK